MHLHRRDRRHAGFAILAIAGLLVSGTDELRAQDEQSIELQRVASVEFEGREKVPAKELLAVMKTKRPSIWPWRDKPVLRLDFLRADTVAIVSVYRRHGYLYATAGVRVEGTDDPARVDVIFEIDEGPRSHVVSIEFSGSDLFAPRDLRKKLITRVGKPFDPTAVIADTAIISREYQERGSIPRVESDIMLDSLDVSVFYHIDSGPQYHMGEVYLSIAGESRIEERLIRREIVIEPGELYRFSKVDLTQERLSQTGFFRTIQLDRLVDSSRAIVEWDLRLRERKPRWIDAGIGSGTTERFRFTGEWGHRNLIGRGFTGVVASRLAFDGNGKFLLARGEVSLTEPWVFGTRTRGTITPYYERTNDRANPGYVLRQERAGLTLRLLRDFGTTRIGRAVRLSLTQDNTFVSQSYDFIDAIPRAVRDSLLASITPRYNTHRLRGAVERDRRNNPFNPTFGSAQAFYPEMAGGPLRGSTNYLKGEAVSAWYTPWRGWTIATRLRAGAIDPFGENRRFTPDPRVDSEVQKVPLEDRFRLGGVNTVRGFNESEIPDGNGGLAMLLGNVELRIPLYGPLGVEFYIDAGNVWSRPTYVKGRDLLPGFGDGVRDPSEARWVYGLGPRLILPFGPLRVDFTWDVRPDADGRYYRGAQFAIGPAF